LGKEEVSSGVKEKFGVVKGGQDAQRFTSLDLTEDEKGYKQNECDQKRGHRSANPRIRTARPKVIRRGRSIRGNLGGRIEP